MAKNNRRQHGEGSIYQRKKDGRWVCELHFGYRPDGKPDRRYLYGDSSEEVIEKRRRFWAAQDDGFTPTKGKGYTVAQWLRHWLHNIVKLEVRESTWVRSYRPYTENRLIPGLGALWLKDDDLEQKIETFYGRLRADGLAPATILQIHRILSHALKVAAKRKLIPRNPCEFVAPPAIDRAEVVPPERNEAGEILAAVRGRWNGARWAVALAVGTRQGETLGLTWPCLDLNDLDNAAMRIAWEIIRLPWQHGCQDPHACGMRRHRFPCPPDPANCPRAQRVAGRRHVCVRACPPKCRNHEAGKCPRFCEKDCVKHASICPERTGGGTVMTEPKSKKSKRTIPLPRPVAELLVEHRTWQEAQRVGNAAWTGWGHDSAECDRRPRAREIVCPQCRKPSKRDMLVFTQPSGRPVDARRDWQEWTDILVELGLPPYRPHDSRHFAATTLLEEGADVTVAQELLGHATAAFTQSTYQHVKPHLLRGAADVMGQALWPSDS